VKRCIHWFRRDLRITDNTALHFAASAAVDVIPAYILSGWSVSHRWTGPNRQSFLSGCLGSLAGNLSAVGGRLILRQGDAVEELIALAKETQSTAIFTNRDPDPYGRAQEVRLARAAAEVGIEVRDFKDACLHERSEVLTGMGDSFRVFSPYSRAWAKLEHPPVLPRITSIRTPASIHSLELPTLGTWKLPPAAGGTIEAGEKAARKRLDDFMDDGLVAYSKQRDVPGIAGTSRLSQDLRFGLLSAREVFARVHEKSQEASPSGCISAAKYAAELVWREFYMQVLWHFPNVLEQEFNPKYRGMKWPGKIENFELWCRGETGFPIVDAAMRQLNETGFMHNRTRMITAMFLTKDLHLDWRLGESYFMQKLVDGEIASNNGGWQWSAGTGADAAPYFRIQNPWSQTKRYDSDAAFIKQWLPELRDVPPAKLCDPPPAGLRVANNYPSPIVDHAEARDVTLRLFGAVGTGS